MHLNAVGGDCPGKTELHRDVLLRASTFVEYEPQTRIEGDIQQMPADYPVTELWRVLAGQAPGRRDAGEVTLFDSVGFALEDYSALRYGRLGAGAGPGPAGRTDTRSGRPARSVCAGRSQPDGRGPGRSRGAGPRQPRALRLVRPSDLGMRENLPATGRAALACGIPGRRGACEARARRPRTDVPVHCRTAGARRARDILGHRKPSLDGGPGAQHARPACPPPPERAGTLMNFGLSRQAHAAMAQTQTVPMVAGTSALGREVSRPAELDPPSPADRPPWA